MIPRFLHLSGGSVNLHILLIRESNISMDNVLLAVFGTLSFIGLSFGSLCTWMAIRAAKANKKDADVSMALWSIGAVAGLAVGSMSFAYFVLPILWDRL